MKELEGRTGIVTGGSSGIGYAIANTLAQAGARVYAISRSGAVKSGMAPSAEGVIHVRGDVTDGARMAEIIREIGEKEGLDFLVNDAGITQKHRAEVFPMETFEQILSVNVTSVFRLCQLCYPYLSKSAHCQHQQHGGAPGVFRGGAVLHQQGGGLRHDARIGRGMGQ